VLAKIRHTLAQPLTEPVVRLLAKTDLSPNTLTILGFLLCIGVASVLATGHIFLGGFLVLLCGWFDLLDGALARLTGQTTTFGALLDSTIDRLSEAALLFGLLILYINHGSLQGPLLLFVVLVGSLLVSYIRARAEGLGLECKVGLFTRAERIVLLALGLILGATWGNALLVILWILAVGTMLTAIHRLYYVWQKTREGGE
jgi:CDP-diacylglycerol--glycerol-3-phosphate 3-phosphatidyltransferase